MKRLAPLLLIAACLLAFKLFSPTGPSPVPSTLPESSAQTTPQTPLADGKTVARAELPAEAQKTLAAIKEGGPFTYDRDGIVFGNFEERLPFEPRGYYHEYTVKTPGSHNRGARRIITAGTPPRIFYYTDDHYQSFRRIQE